MHYLQPNPNCYIVVHNSHLHQLGTGIWPYNKSNKDDDDVNEEDIIVVAVMEYFSMVCSGCLRLYENESQGGGGSFLPVQLCGAVFK